MAYDVDVNSGTLSGGLPVTLTWSEWDGTKYEATYYLDNDVLMRAYSETLPGGGGDSYTTMIAESIVVGSPHTTCQIIASGTKAGEVVFTVTAAEGSSKYERQETRVLEVRPRPGGAA